MPFYKFKNKDTGEEFEQLMGISECDAYLAANPNIEQLVNGFPTLGYNVVRGKPADGFRDLLKEIKKSNSKGRIKSTINTF